MNHPPRCVIVTGRPGSGKTTFSKELARRLWLPVISRDEIKEGYVNTYGVRHDQLPGGVNKEVWDLFFSLVDQYLSRGVSIVIEAAFQHAVWEQVLPRIMDRGRPMMIVCSVAPELAAQRHLQRGLDDPNREFYHGDQRVAIYRETGELSPPAAYEEPDLAIPTVRVSTEGEYLPKLDDLVGRVRAELDLPHG